MTHIFRSCSFQRQLSGSDPESDCSSNDHGTPDIGQDAHVSRKSKVKQTTAQTLTRAWPFQRQFSGSDLGGDCSSNDHETAYVSQDTHVSRQSAGKQTTTQALRKALSFRRQRSGSDVEIDCGSDDHGIAHIGQETHVPRRSGRRKMAATQTIKSRLAALFNGRQQEQPDAETASSNQRWVLPSDPESCMRYDLFRRKFISLPQLDACVEELIENSNRKPIGDDSLRKILTKLCDSLLSESWKVATNVFEEELSQIKEWKEKFLKSETMRKESLGSFQKEVTALKDEHRSSACADIPDVIFFSPLTFLDEATRGMVHAVVEDQLKNIVSEVENGQDNALNQLISFKMEMYREKISHEEHVRAESKFEQRVDALKNDLAVLEQTRREEQETMLEQFRAQEQQLCMLRAEIKEQTENRLKTEKQNMLEQLPTGNQANKSQAQLQIHMEEQVRGESNVESQHERLILEFEQQVATMQSDMAMLEKTRREEQETMLEQLRAKEQQVLTLRADKKKEAEKWRTHVRKLETENQNMLEQLPTTNQAKKSQAPPQIQMEEALDDHMKQILIKIRAAEWKLLPGIPSSTLLKQATALHDVCAVDDLHDCESDIDLIVALVNIGDQVAREACEEVNSTFSQAACDVSPSLIGLLSLQATVARRQAVMFVILSSLLLKALCSFFDAVHGSGLPPGKQIVMLRNLQESRRESKAHVSACFRAAQSSFEQIENARRKLKRDENSFKKERQQENLEEEWPKLPDLSEDNIGSQLRSDAMNVVEAQRHENFKEWPKPSDSSEDTTGSQLKSDEKHLAEAGQQENLEEEWPRSIDFSAKSRGSQLKNDGKHLVEARQQENFEEEWPRSIDFSTKTRGSHLKSDGHHLAEAWQQKNLEEELPKPCHSSETTTGSQLKIDGTHLVEARLQKKLEEEWSKPSDVSEDTIGSQLKSDGKHLAEGRQQHKFEEEWPKSVDAPAKTTGTQLKIDGMHLVESEQQEKLEEELTKPSDSSEDTIGSQLKSDGKHLAEGRQQHNFEEEWPKSVDAPAKTTGIQLKKDGMHLLEARQQEKLEEELAKPSDSSEDTIGSQLNSEGKHLTEARPQENLEEEGPKSFGSSAKTTGSQSKSDGKHLVDALQQEELEEPCFSSEDTEENQIDSACDAIRPALPRLFGKPKQKANLGKSESLLKKDAQASQCCTDTDGFPAMSLNGQSTWTASADQPAKPSSKSQSKSYSLSSTSKPTSGGKHEYYMGPRQEAGASCLPVAKSVQSPRHTTITNAGRGRPKAPSQASHHFCGLMPNAMRPVSSAPIDEFLGVPAAHSLMRLKSPKDLKRRNSTGCL